MSDEFRQDDQNQESGREDAPQYTQFNQYSQPQNPYEQPVQNQNPYSQPQQPQNPYNQPQPPQSPYQQPMYQQPPQNPYGQAQQPYFSNVPVAQQTPSKGLGITGFVLSLIGLLCCGMIPTLPFVGLICSIVARVKGNRSALAVTGIVLGAIGVAIALYFTYAFVIAGSSPAFMESFFEEFYTNYY